MISYRSLLFIATSMNDNNNTFIYVYVHWSLLVAVVGKLRPLVRYVYICLSLSLFEFRISFQLQYSLKVPSLVTCDLFLFTKISQGPISVARTPTVHHAGPLSLSLMSQLVPVKLVQLDLLRF